MSYYEYLQKLPLEEYQAILANRKYWDCASAEWLSSTVEKNILTLAPFVQRGGKLSRVIAKYAEGREYTYRVMIHYCVMDYIEKLLGTNDYYLRIVQLEKREILALLTELLKVGVGTGCERDMRSNEYYTVLRLTDEGMKDDSILVAIEERHKRAHPDETDEQKRRREERWLSGGVKVW